MNTHPFFEPCGDRLAGCGDNFGLAYASHTVPRFGLKLLIIMHDTNQKFYLGRVLEG